MRKRIEIAGGRHLETLRNCGGYYECPEDGQGKCLGPLVGYAGKYDTADGKQLQWVGKVYANFAKAEPHVHVLKFFAECLLNRLGGQINLMALDGFVSAPIGGYSLGDAMGFSMTDVQVIKAEKKIMALATEISREKSKLVFARHNVELGLRYVIVEDVCNNFSTTGELVNLVRNFGGEVVAIACFLNRSPKVDNEFNGIPVVSVVRKIIDEWHQDDPAVAEDVAKGNVVWKPKDEWNRLEAATAVAKTLEQAAD